MMKLLVNFLALLVCLIPFMYCSHKYFSSNTVIEKDLNRARIAANSTIACEQIHSAIFNVAVISNKDEEFFHSNLLALEEEVKKTGKLDDNKIKLIIENIPPGKGDSRYLISASILWILTTFFFIRFVEDYRDYE